MNEQTPNPYHSFEKPPEETDLDGFPPKKPTAEQLRLEKELEASLIRNAVNLVNQGAIPREALMDIRPRTKHKPTPK